MKRLKCLRADCGGEQLLTKDGRKQRSARSATGMTKEEAVRAGWQKNEFGWLCPKHR
jgi:hypothetical protein